MVFSIQVLHIPYQWHCADYTACVESIYSIVCQMNYVVSDHFSSLSVFAGVKICVESLHAHPIMATELKESVYY